MQAALCRASRPDMNTNKQKKPIAARDHERRAR
jgi:hypothetical protein